MSKIADIYMVAIENAGDLNKTCICILPKGFIPTASPELIKTLDARFSITGPFSSVDDISRVLGLPRSALEEDSPNWNDCLSIRRRK